LGNCRIVVSTSGGRERASASSSFRASNWARFGRSPC
jgi:hypothetical protein